MAGAILILPLPLAFGVGLFYGMYLAAHGKQPDPNMQLRMSLVELALTLFCVVLACIVAAVFSEQRRPRRRRYADDLDWEDERPRRRRRRDYEDDDGYEEDEPAARSRDRMEEDEDRPRRRRRIDEDL